MAEVHLGVRKAAELRGALLAWYDANRRDLPWRRTSDPYAIWVSEIMLQQTRVAAVLERYETFLRNFPTVEALAHAAEEDVLTQWSGLGYYRRARSLYKAAQLVAFEHGGVLPTTAEGLRSLPGIGAYTSAAIASIAFGEAAAVVDGNVERVVQRLAGWGSGSATGKASLVRDTEGLAAALLDHDRPGDFNQAMMELGATVCLPRNPLCLLCPLKPHCKTQGEHPTVPRARMSTHHVTYAFATREGPAHGNGAMRAEREVLLEQRSASQTVMPGMWELPTLPKSAGPIGELRLNLRHAIMQVNYAVEIRAVAAGDLPAAAQNSARRHWVPVSAVKALPLTGLARKVLLGSKLAEMAPQSGSAVTVSGS